jgi:DNA polymerase III delta subunit
MKYFIYPISKRNIMNEYEYHKANIEATYDKIIAKLQEPASSDITTITVSKQTKEILTLLEELSGKSDNLQIIDAITMNIVTHYFMTQNPNQAKKVQQLVDQWKDKNGFRKE